MEAERVTGNEVLGDTKPGYIAKHLHDQRAESPLVWALNINDPWWDGYTGQVPRNEWKPEMGDQ